MAPSPPAPSAPTRRGNYKTLTMARKAAIIRQLLESSPLRSKPSPTKILEAEEKVSAGKQKSFRDGSHPKLEEALNMWLRATVGKRIPVPGNLLRQKKSGG
ncbi:hypothetical protein HPB50_003981 [Hyalomma asiaticum]|uniref:Uncharacterized protein n=1 Tax=Hyalomma asiaticum TaxID=266040 RepID=A0ACB7SJV1_HYAAI|nr:hypothetical protein HPB50_003981 [Hyalomma asiaticum]